MPDIRRLIIVAVLALVAGLLILFPARAAYHWFAPPAIALSGLSGSIWSGKARDADLAGVYLQDLTWRMRPLRLLIGRLAYAVEASAPGGFIDGEVGVTFGGSMEVRNFRGTIPLAAPARAAGFDGVGGVLHADIQRLKLTDGVPVLVTGNVNVRDLLLPQVAPTPLGGFVAEILTREDGVVASVEDKEATVDLAGRLLIGSDRSYQFLGKVAPTPQTQPALRRQMQRLGSTDERGQREVRLEGTL